MAPVIKQMNVRELIEQLLLLPMTANVGATWEGLIVPMVKEHISVSYDGVVLFDVDTSPGFNIDKWRAAAGAPGPAQASIDSRLESWNLTIREREEWAEEDRLLKLKDEEELAAIRTRIDNFTKELEQELHKESP